MAPWSHRHGHRGKSRWDLGPTAGAHGATCDGTWGPSLKGTTTGVGRLRQHANPGSRRRLATVRRARTHDARAAHMDEPPTWARDRVIRRGVGRRFQVARGLPGGPDVALRAACSRIAPSWGHSCSRERTLPHAIPYLAPSPALPLDAPPIRRPRRPGPRRVQPHEWGGDRGPDRYTVVEPARAKERDLVGRLRARRRSKTGQPPQPRVPYPRGRGMARNRSDGSDLGVV